MLGVAEGGLGYLVAAVRECFEEAGLLLARDGRGAWVDAAHPVLATRHAVARGEASLTVLCREHGLDLCLDRVAYLDHWVTPPGPPRRFDTRFFVAEAPPGQVPLHDGQETIDHCWLTPRQALADRRTGRRRFATPPRRCCIVWPATTPSRPPSPAAPPRPPIRRRSPAPDPRRRRRRVPAGRGAECLRRSPRSPNAVPVHSAHALG
ncbi:hypothetical protein HML84_05550 [Alcanivorax sp. IO_7]|nr:hypothetical protein HML84_05550 [Alcanivorax sp. IO_7]